MSDDEIELLRTIQATIDELTSKLSSLAAQFDQLTEALDGFEVEVSISALSATSVTITWEPVAGASSYEVSRDGTDSTGYPAWETDVPAEVNAFTFNNLIPNRQYVFTVVPVNSEFDALSSGAVIGTTEMLTTLPSAWNSGAYGTSHSVKEAQAIAKGHVAVFPTRDKGTAGLENTWWMPAKDVGTAISVAVPLSLAGEPVGKRDLTASMTKIAKALKQDGRRAYIRLGWEMNLDLWAHKVTEANLSTWRADYSRYYDAFKTVMGEQAMIGLNPNIGRSQTGMSGDWVSRIWVDGKVDWCGPDAYDCYPAFTTNANVDQQLNSTYGLRWWSARAIAKGVPMALPEWGVASGAQWAGNQGGDNPRYITEMRNFIAWHLSQGGVMLFDTYFSDSSAYLKSDFTSNPKAGAEYHRLWG